MLNIEAAAASRDLAAARWTEVKAQSADRAQAASQARFDDRVREGKEAAAARPRPQDFLVPVPQRLVDITA